MWPKHVFEYPKVVGRDGECFYAPLSDELMDIRRRHVERFLVVASLAWCKVLDDRSNVST